MFAATGHPFQAAGLLRAGKRIHTLEKAFNGLYAGWRREADVPPGRFMEESIVVDGKQLDTLPDAYYALHGCHKETSWPIRRTLEAPDLKEVAKKLEDCDRLPS